MKVSALIVASALALSTAAIAQDTPAPSTQGAPQAGETSDRTPDKATQTPQSQQDTAGDKTSDRSPDKDAKVQHQPGAAGTAGSSSEGASSGASGSNMPADSDAKPDAKKY
jgi:hypothetical protein